MFHFCCCDSTDASSSVRIETRFPTGASNRNQQDIWIQEDLVTILLKSEDDEAAFVPAIPVLSKELENEHAAVSSRSEANGMPLVPEVTREVSVQRGQGLAHIPKPQAIITSFPTQAVDGETFSPTSTSDTLSQMKRSTYTVNLDSTKGGRPGVVFDVTDSRLAVIDRLLDNSLVASWNDSCQQSQIVRPKDALVAVNGKRASSQELVEMLSEKEDFMLTLKRPTLQTIFVKKTGRPLGLWLKMTCGAGLVIQDVDPSACEDLVSKVKQSDRIMAVNGQESTPEKLFELIKSLDSMHLLIATFQ